MKTHQLLALATVVLSAGAIAQTQIGTVVSVAGLVTMSDANSVTTVVLSTPVRNGSSFVTSSTGNVVLRVNGNCIVTLTPNQTATVSSDQTCNSILAGITPLPAGGAVAGGTAGGGAGGVAGAGGAGGGAFLPVVGAAAIAGVIANNGNSPNRPVSPQ
ncbi:hypothetical protein GHT07_06175 [Caenimonas koreensis DSM 17982]|uniref:Uncharacterized protein n=1 Tax=Caenimonas koreensis DSM 17982 TaxID=1121255 RepID=A0A844AS18_9BURK|nr:hypothetical protein [Caenimonas koreensis]MRD46854.1 hypothetical protein [Caenimonas koreensis DSM 17982]